MSRTFFISDTHFSHKNIIHLANRPFKSVDEMNQTLVNNWNEVVTAEEDIVYHLGDFAWSNAEHFFHRLNGRKHLILGNHDPRSTTSLSWESVVQYLEISVDGYNLVLFHYPIWDWNGRYRSHLHLFGHVHGGNPMPLDITSKTMAYDVGVEMINYRPTTIEELLELPPEMRKG